MSAPLSPPCHPTNDFKSPNTDCKLLQKTIGGGNWQRCQRGISVDLLLCLAGSSRLEVLFLAALL